MSVWAQSLLSGPEPRLEGWLSKWDEVIIRPGKLKGLTKTSKSCPNLLNTIKISLPSPHLAFQKEGGFGGFVWIGLDRTGPLLGSVFRFSVHWGWGASRPSHPYEVSDSPSVPRLWGKAGRAPCVSICLWLICQASGSEVNAEKKPNTLPTFLQQFSINISCSNPMKKIHLTNKLWLSKLHVCITSKTVNSKLEYYTPTVYGMNICLIFFFFLLPY